MSEEIKLVGDFIKYEEAYYPLKPIERIYVDENSWGDRTRLKIIILYQDNSYKETKEIYTTNPEEVEKELSKTIAAFTKLFEQYMEQISVRKTQTLRNV